MKKMVLLLILLTSAATAGIIQEKFKAKGAKSHYKYFKFGKYQVLMGSCVEGSSLGIYNGKVSPQSELFYACNIAPGQFTQIFQIEGFNTDSLPDFVFSYLREDTPQLYALYSLSPTVYHFEFVKELLDAKTLEIKPPSPFKLSQLNFIAIQDVNGDLFPEVLNNVFTKSGQLHDWPDISDTISLEEVRQAPK